MSFYYNKDMSDTTIAYYKILQSHDRRFDGLFFVGVTTTGIYCRPVCRVRMPKEQHCHFFTSTAAAEQAGFRPCLKCRPELAPGRESGRTIAQLAARLIDEGFLHDMSLQALARKLHVTERHLRRVFKQHWEVTPVMYSQTQKLLLAKHLLASTSLSVTAIAFAAGFKSLSRFNTLFSRRYHLSPSEIRKKVNTPQTDNITVSVGYRTPFDWPSLLRFLAGRAIPGVEYVEADSYSRTVSIERHDTTYTGWITVRNNPRESQLQIALPLELVPVVSVILSKVKHLFDTECQPGLVAATLGPLAKDAPGLRLPGAFDGFEMSVRAVLGQQITVKAATTVTGSLAARFGRSIVTPYPQLTTLFPTPTRLAAAARQEIVDCGIYSRRADTIHHIATACATGLDLSPEASIDQSRHTLLAIPGIGEWTADYIAMRALGWPDAFLPTDYAIKKVLHQTAAKRILEHARQWQPWRAYATMHIWHSLDKKGV